MQRTLAICFLISCSTISVIVIAATPDRAHDLAGQPAQISKLDWILLTARVRSLEYSLAHETGRRSFQVGMFYVPDDKKIRIKVFVDPAFATKAQIEGLRELITTDSSHFCAEGYVLALGERGELPAMSNVRSDCAVDFFTWRVSQRGEPESKEIASYDAGKITLR